jgi:anti-sigma regulatory factor (Ser/Thr protein kinase)
MGETGGGAYARTFTPETCDYTTLRQELGDWLETFGVERVTVEDWRLILTELATNACESTPASGEITCVATCANNRIDLTVSNPVKEPATIHPAPRFDPTSERGGGLFIVDAIVHGITYDIDNDSVTIRCWTPVERY